MNRHYYRKTKSKNIKKTVRLASMLLISIGVGAVLYIGFPLISWHIYFAPTFASQNIAYPIPQTMRVTNTTIGSLLSQASKNIKGVDYTNAQNWFPNYKTQDQETQASSYSLSIPKLGIKDATVSAVSYDLSKHLVHFGNTPFPPSNGNTVIFGHSTLPQLFNPTDYKTIFATLHNLRINDEIFTQVENVTYKYKVIRITVVDSNDTSPLIQQYDNAYITLITCTPPGTTWKRLVIKTRLEKI